MKVLKVRHSFSKPETAHARPHRPLCVVKLIAVALLGALSAGCQNQPPPEIAVWSEFLPPALVMPHIETLAAKNATLYIAVRPDELNDELADLIRQANAAGVAVHPWLQLPDMGIWVNEFSAAAFAVFAFEYLDWADARGLTPHWLIFDLEPPFELSETLAATVESLGLLAAVDLLQANHDPATFDAATDVLKSMVDDLHARDVRATAVILPWIIDDLSDGDRDIADAFETPLEGIDWDRISAILYRPTFARFFDMPLSPGFVSSYASTLRSRYGDRVEIALGNIGDEGLLVGDGYTDTARITEDLTAIRTVGVNRISLFSLDGMIGTGGPARWMDAATSPTIIQSQIDLRVAVIRTGFGIFDRILDD